jgi:hypothetical protein
MLMLGTPSALASESGRRPARVHFMGGLGGLGGSYVEGEESWAFLVSYEQAVSDVWSVELSYFNEGHPDPKSHRDGFALQAFADLLRLPPLAETSPGALLAEHARLRAGVGPTIDFDTVDGDAGKREETGAGFKLTGVLDVAIAGRLSAGPRVEGHVAIDSQTALVVGLDVAYELFPAPPRARPGYGAAAATGYSVRNAQGGAGTPAYVALQASSLLGVPDLGASAAFLSIDGPNQRRGFAIGPDLVRRFGDDARLSLGFGLAPYFYDDAGRSGPNASGVAALIKAMASYRVVDRLSLMAMFVREAGSPEQENYDVILGGIAVDFEAPWSGREPEPAP